MPLTSSVSSGSYPGPMPPAPAPPAVAETALVAGSPALGLGLNQITIIVAGDVNISSTVQGVVIQRR